MICTLKRIYKYQTGVAAIEFALVLPILVGVLVITAFFGRVFWHYTVAMKAATDTAVFLATAPRAEMAVSKADFGEVDIVRMARTIGEAEVAELRPGSGPHPPVDISCDALPCRGESVPSLIIVGVKMKVIDPIFAGYTGELLENGGVVLHAEVRVQYVGN